MGLIPRETNVQIKDALKTLHSIDMSLAKTNECLDRIAKALETMVMADGYMLTPDDLTDDDQ